VYLIHSLLVEVSEEDLDLQEDKRSMTRKISRRMITKKRASHCLLLNQLILGDNPLASQTKCDWLP
jgi:hypothetical protein